MKIAMLGFFLVIAVTSAIAAPSSEIDDSLQSAINAIARKRRNLAMSNRPYSAFNRNRGRYRYPVHLKRAPYRVPEDQDYMVEYEGPEEDLDEKELEYILAKMLVDYIDDKNEEDGRSKEYEDKRKRNSVFREREVGVSSPAISKKRSLFRERNIEAEKRKRYLGTMKRMVEKKEEKQVEESSEESDEMSEEEKEYLEYLASLWENYKKHFPESTLSSDDIHTVLDYLQNNYGLDADMKKRKRFLASDYVPPLVAKKEDMMNEIEGYPSPGSRLRPVDFPYNIESLYEEEVKRDGRSELPAELLVARKRASEKEQFLTLLNEIADKWNTRSEPWEYEPESEEKLAARKRYILKKRPMVHEDSIEPDMSQMANEKLKKSTTDPRISKELSDIFSGKDKESWEGESEETEDQDTSRTEHWIDEDDEEENKMDVSKKDNNLSDYFGYDKKKRPDRAFDDWLKEEYMKSMAKATGLKRKRTFNDFDFKRKRFLENTAESRESSGMSEEWKEAPQVVDAESAAAKEESGDTEESGEDTDTLQDMEGKIQTLEDMMLDESLKYVGAHEGTKDRSEIEEVKKQVLSRLSAAYSLEKMREALEEFRTSLRGLQEEREEEEKKRKRTESDEVSDNEKFETKRQPKRAEEEDEEDKKRTVKKNISEEEEKRTMKKGNFAELVSETQPEKKQAENDKRKKSEEIKESEEKKKKKRGEIYELEDGDPSGKEDGPMFLEETSQNVPGMAAGYENRPGEFDNDCPALRNIITNCETISNIAGDYRYIFLDACNRHEVCYTCGEALGVSAPTTCDVIFLDEADDICGSSVPCHESARKAVLALRELRTFKWENMKMCVRDRCIAEYLFKRKR